ncbi:MAG: DNA repair protein RadC [Candidatus Sericytochromatia bacterium]|nr:DNA repair protein RadC [Candidatus Sericytochromatia bacterium]
MSRAQAGGSARAIARNGRWASGLAPRERLATRGAASLSEAELLALLLGTGDARHSALQLAEMLLSRYQDAGDPSGLTGLLRAAAGERLSVRGIGPVKQARLAAVQEMGRRLRASSLQPPSRIDSPEASWRHLAPRLEGLDREHFGVLSLNRKHAPLGFDVVAIGSLEAVLVHPREVFRAAIRRGAAAIVLAHNHPSGDPTPSPEDHALTRRLLGASDWLGIEVLDHLVIGAGGFVSLRETSDAWRRTRTPVGAPG